MESNVIRIDLTPLAHPSGGYYLELSSSTVINEFFDVFEKAGSYSNGPAWEGLVRYLADLDPPIYGLDTDDEADACLILCSTKDPMVRLARRLSWLFEDTDRLTDAIQKGQAAGYGFGDL